MSPAWTKAVGCTLLLSSVAYRGEGSGTSTSAGTTTTTSTTTQSGTPVVDATVATITLGPYASGLGIQGIALTSDRSLAYVAVGTRTTVYANGACQGSTPGGPPAQGQVAVLDTASRAKVTDIPVSVGTPVHVELDPVSNRIYVASSPGAVYGLAGTSIVATNTSIGGVPHDLGIDGTIGRAVVTNTFTSTQTFMSFVTLPSLTVTGTVESGFGPHKVATDPDRHLAYVTHAEFAKVDVVDLQAGTLLRQIDTTVAGGSAQNAIDLTRRRLFTVGQTPGASNSSRLIAIDLATEEVLGTVALPDGSHGSRVDPVTGFVWVLLSDQHQVAVIDPATLTEKARVPVGHCPFYLDVDSNRRLAYVTNQGDNTVTVVDMTRVADTSAFTDTPLVAGTTTIKAVHIAELRRYVNTLRERYGLTAFSWTDPVLAVGTTTIRAVHITELQTALAATYVAAGRTVPAFTAVSAGATTVTIAQLNELRNAVLAIY